MTTFKDIGEDLFIGSQPAQQDIAEAKRVGIRTVIDLRMPAETGTPNADMVENHGLTYVNVPVDKSALSQQHIVDLDRAMGRTQGPYLLHCATGARAALLLSLSRAKQHGWTAERTFDEAEAMGFALRETTDFANFVRQVAAK
ncbi:MAG: sulfur transferase domain-containing protein [Telluria sp.]